MTPRRRIFSTTATPQFPRQHQPHPAHRAGRPLSRCRAGDPQRARGNTDLGIGLAGGGLADSYTYVNQGNYVPEESFFGHLGELSASLYHRFNPGQQIPALPGGPGQWPIHSLRRRPGTAADFQVPGDLWTGRLRTGLRWGGKEPVLFPELAMECSIWYEGVFRSRTETYGYSGESRVNPQTHQFWARDCFTTRRPDRVTSSA